MPSVSQRLGRRRRDPRDVRRRLRRLPARHGGSGEADGRRVPGPLAVLEERLQLAADPSGGYIQDRKADGSGHRRSAPAPATGSSRAGRPVHLDGPAQRRPGSSTAMGGRRHGTRPARHLLPQRRRQLGPHRQRRRPSRSWTTSPRSTCPTSTTTPGAPVQDAADRPRRDDALWSTDPGRHPRPRRPGGDVVLVRLLRDRHVPADARAGSELLLSAPLFPQVTVNRGNGKTISITAPGAATYVQSLTVNGAAVQPRRGCRSRSSPTAGRWPSPSAPPPTRRGAARSPMRRRRSTPPPPRRQPGAEPARHRLGVLQRQRGAGQGRQRQRLRRQHRQVLLDRRRPSTCRSTSARTRASAGHGPPRRRRRGERQLEHPRLRHAGLRRRRRVDHGRAGPRQHGERLVATRSPPRPATSRSNILAAEQGSGGATRIYEFEVY